MIPETPGQAKMLEIFYHPEIQECLRRINALVCFDIAKERKKIFFDFHQFITADIPYAIENLKENNPKHYSNLSEGILGHTQNAFLTVHYHYTRLIKIDKELNQVLEDRNFQELMKNTGIAGGNSIILDSEYQAYVLAYRRTLDYFTRAILAFFKSQAHSFREMPDRLSKLKPEPVAHALIEAHKRHSPKMRFILSESENKTTRDKISHYEFVPAGVINMNSKGIFIAGGGEKLSGFSQTELSSVLNAKTDAIQECIEDMLLSFMQAVRHL